jgi:DNA repair protein RadC
MTMPAQSARRPRLRLAHNVTLVVRETAPVPFLPKNERPRIRSPRDAWNLVKDAFEDQPAEVFGVILLDAQHCSLFPAAVEVTRGILNSSLVHPREVFARAIVERAAAIVLVHNHPSGDPTPSIEDRLVTQQLVAAGNLLDLPVHDHIIVGRGRYTSFAEAGLL